MVQALPTPPKMKVVQSAGAVVWRFVDGVSPTLSRIPQDRDEVEVLLVHRPRYNDWSWPKGKKEIRESLPACAVREVEEETGYSVRLGAPLTTQRYRLGLGATKEVYYWVGFLDLDAGALKARACANRAPIAEIDCCEWVGVTEAKRRLGRRGDKRLLDELLVRLDRRELFTHTLVMGVRAELDGKAEAKARCLVVGKAESYTQVETTTVTVSASSRINPAIMAQRIRKLQVKTSLPAGIEEKKSLGVASTLQQRKDGENRALSRLGANQALRLVSILSAYGVSSLECSPYRSAKDTLLPYSVLSGIEINTHEMLLPSQNSQQEQQLRALVQRCFRAGEKVAKAVCSHPQNEAVALEELGKVCPSWLVRYLPDDDHPTADGSVLVMHLAPDLQNKALKLFDVERYELD